MRSAGMEVECGMRNVGLGIGMGDYDGWNSGRTGLKSHLAVHNMRCTLRCRVVKSS